MLGTAGSKLCESDAWLDSFKYIFSVRSFGRKVEEWTLMKKFRKNVSLMILAHGVRAFCIVKIKEMGVNWNIFHFQTFLRDFKRKMRQNDK